MFIHTLYKRKSKDEYKKMFYSDYNMMNMMNMNTGYGYFSNPFSMMGGYGMTGSYMMMPSIFNFGGGYGMYGGFGCGCNVPDDSALDSMAGFAVATGLMGVGVMALGSHLRNKAENSNENKLSQNQQSLNDLLNRLDRNADETNYSKFITDAENDMNTKKGVYESKAALIDDANAIINSYDNDVTALRAQLNGETDSAKINEINEQIRALDIKKANAEQIQKDYNNAKREYETAQNKYNNFKQIGEQIAGLIDEKIAIEKKIKKENDRKELNAADGTFINRTTEKAFTKMYDFNTGTFGTKKDGSAYSASDFTASDIRYLINKYKNGNIEEKRQIQAFLSDNRAKIQDKALKGSNEDGVNLILEAELG